MQVQWPYGLFVKTGSAERLMSIEQAPVKGTDCLRQGSHTRNNVKVRIIMASMKPRRVESSDTLFIIPYNAERCMVRKHPLDWTFRLSTCCEAKECCTILISPTSSIIMVCTFAPASSSCLRRIREPQAVGENPAQSGRLAVEVVYDHVMAQ